MGAMHASVRSWTDDCCSYIQGIGCMQVFVSTEVAAEVGGLKALTSTGTSVLVQGTLRRTPEGTLQVHAPCDLGIPPDNLVLFCHQH